MCVWMMGKGRENRVRKGRGAEGKVGKGQRRREERKRKVNKCWRKG